MTLIYVEWAMIVPSTDTRRCSGQREQFEKSRKFDGEKTFCPMWCNLFMMGGANIVALLAVHLDFISHFLQISRIIKY